MTARNRAFPIQVLVNYWEDRPSKMGDRLDELLRGGVHHVATFVPWKAVEADISHGLAKFLMAAHERNISVSLILSPEIGVHYPNSGLPNDVLKPEIRAKDQKGKPFIVGLAPNAVALPSLFAPEFTKRYQNFLSRMDNLLYEIGRASPGVLDRVSVALTGSFWKYYREAATLGGRAFATTAGDVGSAAAVAYRQEVSRYFGGKEFSGKNAAAANRWKTLALEETNRRWFLQQSEEVFRARSTQIARRKSFDVELTQLEVFAPEGDPGYHYSHWLQQLGTGYADFGALSGLVDEFALRASAAEGDLCSPFVHWTGLGGFRGLADAEKQFLVLKALLLLGGRGGGVLVDEDEWFGFSQSFRSRVEALARGLARGELRMRSTVAYLVPHLWGDPGDLVGALEQRAGAQTRIVASHDALESLGAEPKLLLVDPTWIMTRETIERLVQWVSAGSADGERVLALPRSPLFSESARDLLEEVLRRETRERVLDVDLGVPYRIHQLGAGKLVLFDLPEGLTTSGELGHAWKSFLDALFAIADVEPSCRVLDGRLSTIALDRRDGALGVFILNGTRRAISTEVRFPCKVAIGDLAVSLAMDVSSAERQEAFADRFAIEAPPCGVLPLQVTVLGRHMRESRQAEFSAEALDEGVAIAAVSELPGYGAGGEGGAERPWN